MSEWGWRVPLWIGCGIIPLLFVIRWTLAETDEFLHRADRPAFGEVMRSLARSWRILGLGILLATLTTVAFYLITVYTPTFGSTTLHLGARENSIVILVVGVSNFVLLPIMGSVSDRLGRRPMLIGSAILFLATAYPLLLWLTLSPSFARLLSVAICFAILYASYNGAMVAFLTEIMPQNVRTSGFSIAYSLATAVFGGFTPAICTFLIHATGNPAMPGVWLSVAAACGILASALLSQKVHREVRHLATSQA